eukprot:CAMPEP_0185769700 /NCGR_PEP_ID=MMETSP1174-20130828/55506_1 /TAXON_ID=35687 /ORGANISM="Dictyocha speculum, Strain CCMP1381" /LENGTH=213 /DNA_ID=CAMNT_0028454865 /DNA_START=36 /DNA_END=677 /DNA_ORIENTATION=+
MSELKFQTVAILRGELASLGLSTHGIKSDLVTRLAKAREALDTKAATASVTTPSTVRTAVALESKKKRTVGEVSGFGGDSKRRSARALVFEDEKDAAAAASVDQASDEVCVQASIHAHIGYQRRGIASDLSASQQALFDFVNSEVKIPQDFDLNHKYGPISGVSYEMRVITSFIHGLFDPEITSSRALNLRSRVRRCVFDGDFEAASRVVFGE